MSKPPPKPIVTEGDSKVNVVDALGDLTLVTKQLTSAITHLNDFVSENITDGTPKKIIIKQIKLIAKASLYAKEIISDIKSNSGFKSITSRDESCKRAASNLNFKLETKLKNFVQKIIFILMITS